MKSLRYIPFIVCTTFILFFIPKLAFAADFTIEEVRIDAYLQEDGTVKVEESHTYDYRGDFNGISRSLIPQENSDIVDFVASEDDVPLEVEREDNQYLIYRGGEDETITIDLFYTVTNGVHVYEDVADFYYPFFDRSNESDYKQMDVYVHPPQEVEPVIAYGEDAAANFVTTEEDGTVLFAMGHVNSGENGNIRVTFDADVFPLSTVLPGFMQDSIMQEFETYKEQQERFETRAASLDASAPYFMVALVLYLLLLFFYMWRRRSTLLHEVDRTSSTVPSEGNISLTGIIAHMKYDVVNTDLLTASLLDLVRKGYVKHDGEKTFEVIDWQAEHSHETILLKWLFTKIGNDGTFMYSDLDQYLEHTKNHETFYQDFEAWKKEVLQELKQNHLRERKGMLRTFIGLSSLPLIPYAITLGIHQLFLWMALAIVFALTLVMIALFYHPRTITGIKLHSEWKGILNYYRRMDKKDWHQLSDDEKLRATIYTLGFSHKTVDSKHKQLGDSLSSSHSSTVAPLILIALATNEHFSHATRTASASDAGSHGSPPSGGGAGAGGGGGGSGGF